MHGPQHYPNCHTRRRISDRQRGFLLLRNLIEAVIPDSVNVIGWQAFAWCKKLTGAVIPAGVTRFEKNAFENAACEDQVKLDYSHLFE